MTIVSSRSFLLCCVLICDGVYVCLSIQDRSIATSLPVLDLIDAMQPQSVNFELVRNGDLSDEDKLSNAK